MPLGGAGVQLDLRGEQRLLVAFRRRRLQRVAGAVDAHLRVVDAVERSAAPHGAVRDLACQAAVQLRVSRGTPTLGVLDRQRLVLVG